MVGGTIGAQFLILAVTPLLTRIYNAEQFAIFGMFTSSMLVLGKLSNLRYDLAIPLPATEQRGKQVLLLSLAVAALFCGAMALFLILSQSFSVETVVDHTLFEYSYLLVLTTLLFIYHESLITWLIRSKDFLLISSVRFANAFVLGAVQVSGYLFSGNTKALIYATPISLILGLLFMLTKVQLSAGYGDSLSYTRLKRLALRYRKFATFTMPASLMYELSGLLPLVCLTYFGYVTTAGHFFLARRIGLFPSSVLGRSISQVNQSDLANLHRNNSLTQVLLPQIRNIQWALFIPAVAAVLIAPYFSTYFFGAEWQKVGLYLQFISFYVYIRLVYSPTNALADTIGQQNLALAYDTAGTIVAVGVMFLLCFTGLPDMSILAYFVVLTIIGLMFRIRLLSLVGCTPLSHLLPTIVQSSLLLLAGSTYYLLTNS